MTGKELYEKHKGKEVFLSEIYPITGIVCGYEINTDDPDLIIAITKGGGWVYVNDEKEIIETHINNAKGYYYITEKDIID